MINDVEPLLIVMWLCRSVGPAFLKHSNIVQNLIRSVTEQLVLKIINKKGSRQLRTNVNDLKEDELMNVLQMGNDD